MSLKYQYFQFINIIFDDHQIIYRAFLPFFHGPHAPFLTSTPLSASLITSIGTTYNGLSPLDISCQRKIQLIRISVLSP
jgi:hypothetical protein